MIPEIHRCYPLTLQLLSYTEHCITLQNKKHSYTIWYTKNVIDCFSNFCARSLHFFDHTVSFGSARYKSVFCVLPTIKTAFISFNPYLLGLIFFSADTLACGFLDEISWTWYTNIYDFIKNYWLTCLKAL